MSKVLPYNAPSRADLLERLQRAESILEQRTIVPESTRQDLLRVLRGGSVSEPKRGRS